MTLLGRIRGGLLRLARLLGRINTLLLLTISFFLLLLPLSLLHRLLDRPRSEPGWLPRKPLPTDHFRKQY